ncbi:ATP-dependent DNA helicase [Frankliniella fusca]|uniref:ATP-dependent DNA helicase n=1 Tax=Frankliniella fusca TaxID=407009 RepID=A0AAE1LC97_9NEOP|nr:ATP-dependent DNA helicase [Frankliniella fusca]
MRAISDPNFAKWLTTVRDGSANIKDTDVIILPDDLVVGAPEPSNANDDNTLMVNMLNGVILSPTNDVVRDVNEIITKKLPGSSRCYLSKTSLDVEDCAHGGQGFQIAQEELDNIRPARIPPHRLEMKIGSVIMLLLNMNKRQGLCNGTRFVVTGMYKDMIRVKRIAPFRGLTEEIYLPRLFMRTDDVPVAGSIKRLQIPVTLASCITINKAQEDEVDTGVTQFMADYQTQPGSDVVTSPVTALDFDLNSGVTQFMMEYHTQDTPKDDVNTMFNNESEDSVIQASISENTLIATLPKTRNRLRLAPPVNLSVDESFEGEENNCDVVIPATPPSQSAQDPFVLLLRGSRCQSTVPHPLLL